MTNALEESLMGSETEGERGIGAEVYPSHLEEDVAVSGYQQESHAKSIHHHGPNDTLRAVLTEARKQLWLAFPMVCVNLLQYSVTIVSISFCGHLGKLELASASLAQSVANVLGYYVVLGMASALETYCGQAYGAKRYNLLGVYLQRSLIVLYVACIPLSFVFLYMEKLLKMIGQAPDIAQKAGEYAFWLLPSLYGSALFQPLVKFLQSQGLVFPMVATSASAFSCHFLLCWLIMHKFHWGFPGAALATGISFWINAALLVLYIYISKSCRHTWTGFTKDAVKDMKPFSRLLLYSAVMLCLEFWYFEILLMLSGLLPNSELELSTLSICLSTVTLNYMIPFGLSAAASTRVSNELGADNPKAVKVAVYVAVSISLGQACIVAFVIVLVRKVWGYIFSSDLQVVQYVARLLFFLAVSTIMDGIQGILSGVLRGCGRQELGVAINLAAFYGIGIPIGAVMAFMFKLGGTGIYIGLVSGLSVQTLIISIVTFNINWRKEADLALGNVNRVTLITSSRRF